MMGALRQWILGRPKHSVHLCKDTLTYLDDHGHLTFSPNDVYDPHNWSHKRRWFISVVAVLLAANATFASSSPTGVLDSMTTYFHVSKEAANLTVTLFLLGYCSGPLLFAPLSEFYGRQPVFRVTFAAYSAFSFLCAFAPNFPALLVGRFLTGLFSSASLSNAPGVLADVWGATERGKAMALFGCLTFGTTSISPVIAGFLNLTKDWRWNFYVQLWLAAPSLVLTFIVPETYAQVLLVEKAKYLRQLTDNPTLENIQAPTEASGRTLPQTFKTALLRPFQIALDPISLLVAIYIAFVWTLLYMLYSIYPIVFQEKRGWNTGVGQLPLIGIAIGTSIGAILDVMVSKWVQASTLCTKQAEDRLPTVMLGGLLFPISIFWFGWTSEFNSVHWAVSSIAGTFVSTSIVVIFVGCMNYLTDTYLAYTASSMAVNLICRAVSSAAAPLYVDQMFHDLGVGGGASLIGGLGVLLAPIPFVFWKYGHWIRAKSKFTSASVL